MDVQSDAIDEWWTFEMPLMNDNGDMSLERGENCQLSLVNDENWEMWLVDGEMSLVNGENIDMTLVNVKVRGGYFTQKSWKWFSQVVSC